MNSTARLHPPRRDRLEPRVPLPGPARHSAQRSRQATGGAERPRGRRHPRGRRLAPRRFAARAHDGDDADRARRGGRRRAGASPPTPSADGGELRRLGGAHARRYRPAVSETGAGARSPTNGATPRRTARATKRSQNASAVWLKSLDAPTFIVAHGGVLRALFHLLAGLPAHDAPHLAVPQDRVILFTESAILTI